MVIVDDADRLTPNELQQLFQLVKVNADFPNLVYLLLDREIAEKHIEKASRLMGRITSTKSFKSRSMSRS